MSDVERFIQRQKHTQDFFDKLTYHIYQGFLEDCRALFLKKYRGQDKFFESNYNHIRTIVGLYSQRHCLDYLIFVDGDKIILKCDVYNPSVLKSMNDDFWQKFTQLNQIGNLSFSSFRGTSFIKNKINKKPVKSSIYGIIREIILMEEYDDVSVDFGCLELEMGLVEENEFDNEREVIANALNILYSINQEMHRKTPAHLRRE